MLEYHCTAKLKKNKKKKGFIPNSTLVLFAFATAFFPRVLESLGAPSPVNFLHFFTIPFACGVTILTNRSRNRSQVITTQSMLIALLLFFFCILASALINEAGMINSILQFLLLAEPFLLLIAIISIPMSPESFAKFKKFLIGCLFSHLFLVYFQKYILGVEGWDNILLEPPDRIQGVFFLSGAGHVVGGAVSLTFGVYYLITTTKSPFWLRIIVALSTVWHVVMSDAKQVILAFMVAGVLLFFTQLNDISVALQYLIAGILVGSVFFWCMQNLEAFSSFNTWVRPELYGPDGEATLLKTATFRIVPTHYESVLNWFFGLGPGHTVGRLGGWMLREYASLLGPFGSTMHPASSQVWRATGESWLGTQSSMFSPLFSWAGIWGDLGLLGLGAYLYLSFLIWRHLCYDDVSRFLLLTVLVFGLIFSQMEEPGYMLTIAAIIGLQYQEKFLKKASRKKIK